MISHPCVPILFVCFIIICVFSKSSAELNFDGTELEIKSESLDDDITILRDGLIEECNILTIWISSEDFVLTNEDIDILQNCPLKEMIFEHTDCFSQYLVELSNLTSLEALVLNCKQNHFIITSLPASLQILYTDGVTETNFRLENTDEKFGEHLEFVVPDGSMCCPHTLRNMFGRTTSPETCFDQNQKFLIKTNDGVVCFREQLRGGECDIRELNVIEMKNFSLTREDVDILKHCPLEILKLDNSACISPSLGDLSRLTTLEYISMEFCTSTDFVITGLPESLKTLSVPGTTEKNFRINNTVTRFGESLHVLRVNSPSMCCSQGLVDMFGSDLSHVDCQYEVGSWLTITCGLSEDRTRLYIVSKDDVDILRNNLADDCQLVLVFVKLPDFIMTKKDIESLSRCPLKELNLADSKCFSGSAVDLTSLKNLTHLRIQVCRSSNFVITRLPASLQVVYVPGLAEFNIRLEGDATGFGGALTSLEVFSGAMCCNDTMYNMFSRDLSSVCEDVNGNRCGLAYIQFGKEHLLIDNRQLFIDYTQQVKYSCDLNLLFATSADFFLTQEDVDILAECPLNSMFLPYSSCFSGPVDLSVLSQLQWLFLPHCTSLDFTITGLPSALLKLDIRGMEVDNIRIRNMNQSIGSKLEQLETSHTTTCTCPQAAVKMFGKPLPDNTICGLTESIYSASVKSWGEAFISDGLNSAISSCEDLIDNPALRILLWLMAVVATGGNLAVLLYRCLWDRQHLRACHSIYPCNLALSDLLMGLYLLIIAGADSQFRGEYALFDEEWRLGPVCHVAGFLSTLSSETSAMFILFITLDRFLAIQFPFGQYRLSLRKTWLLCGTTWLTGLLIASLPLIISDWEVYSYNSICVGLPLSNDAYKGSIFSTAIFIGMNSFLFFLIAFGQAGIYRANWINSKRAALSEEQAKRRYKQDLSVARQLSLIVITDFLCWFPICVMGLMAKTGHRISNSAYAWSAVVVIPLNSAINPLLYTLRNVFTKAINRCQTKSGLQDNTNSIRTVSTTTNDTKL